MTHTIPAPVLAAVQNLAGLSEENALQLAAAAMSRSTITQFASTDDALEFLQLLQQHIAGTNPMVALSSMVGNIKTRAPSASPHAPQRRAGRKPPFWVKVVKYYHPTTMNGYGLVGKFINADNAHLEPDGSAVVVQFKDFKTGEKAILVMVRDDQASGVVAHHFGVTLNIDKCRMIGVACSNYKDVYEKLASIGVPTGPAAGTT